MKRFLTILIFVAALSPVQLFAATFYVRADATGTNKGTSWTNAYKSLPGTLGRGNTYYIAGGSYSGYSFSDPDSGQTVITVRKATAADHGSATDWQDSYGADQAVFAAPVTFRTDFFILDGASRTSATSGHGIKIKNSGSSSVNLALGDTTPTVSASVTIRYVEVEGSHSRADTPTDAGIYIARGSNNALIQYSYVHDTGNCLFFMRGTTGTVVEYGYFARNSSTSLEHAEGISASEGVNNLTVRYNVWEDVEGTAYIATASGSTFKGGNAIANWYIYGNVFRYSPTNATQTKALARGGCGDGILAVFDIKVTGDFDFYNNSIVNINKGSTFNGGAADIQLGIGTTVTMDRIYIKNNLWYNSYSITPPYTNGNGVTVTDPQWSYNSFYSNATTDTDPHKQVVASTDPFKDWANGDYRLTAATAAGLSLNSPFDLDPNGVTRSIDGTWDRGAYEFDSDSNSSAPAAPTGLRIN